MIQHKKYRKAREENIPTWIKDERDVDQQDMNIYRTHMKNETTNDGQRTTTSRYQRRETTTMNETKGATVAGW